MEVSPQLKRTGHKRRSSYAGFRFKAVKTQSSMLRSITDLSFEVHKIKQEPLPQGKIATRIYTYYGEKTKKEFNGSVNGIYEHYTIDEFISYTNTLKPGGDKDEQAFLKGIYKGGTSSGYCQTTTDILFFDIDVKAGSNKQENPHLLNNANNVAVFNALKKSVIFIGRSNSRNGMFGAIHVKGLSQYTKEALPDTFTYAHNALGKAVYRELEHLVFEETGLTIQMDDAQAKFRQPRFVAHQDEGDKLSINPDYATPSAKSGLN